MTLKRLFVSLGRRWYLTLFGLLVTVGLCAAAYANTEPTLQRSASELLVPAQTTIPIGSNPYLYLGGLGQLSDVLVSSVNSEQTLGVFTERFPHTTIVVARDSTTSGPMITVTVTGTDERTVAGALDAVAAQVPKSLARLQTAAAVPPGARVSIITLTADDKSTVIEKARVETVALVGVAGVVVTILLVGLIDGLLLGRRRRALERAEAEAQSGPHQDEEDGTRPAKQKKPRRRGKAPRPAPETETETETTPARVAEPERVTAAEASGHVDETNRLDDEQDIDWDYLLDDSTRPSERESTER